MSRYDTALAAITGSEEHELAVGLAMLVSGQNPDGSSLGGSSSAVGTTSKGYRQATSTGAAQLLSGTIQGGIPTGATKVLLLPAADVRVRDDGTNPTATVGYLLAAGVEWNYDSDQLAALKVINASLIDCWFYA